MEAVQHQRKFVAYLRVYLSKNRKRAELEAWKREQLCAFKDRFSKNGQILIYDQKFSDSVHRTRDIERPGLEMALAVCKDQKATLVYADFGERFYDPYIAITIDNFIDKEIQVMEFPLPLTTITNVGIHSNKAKRQKFNGWQPEARKKSYGVRHQKSLERLKKSWRVVRWVKWDENQDLKDAVKNLNKMKVGLEGTKLTKSATPIHWTEELLIELMLRRLEIGTKQEIQSSKGLRKIQISEQKSFRKVAEVLSANRYKTISGAISNWHAGQVQKIVKTNKK